VTPVKTTPLQSRVDQITAHNTAVVAEAKRIVEQDAAAREDALRRMKEWIVGLCGGWRRPCFICESVSWCTHREPELVEFWERGMLR